MIEIVAFIVEAMLMLTASLLVFTGL